MYLKKLGVHFVNYVPDNNNWDITDEKQKQVTTNMTSPR